MAQKHGSHGKVPRQKVGEHGSSGTMPRTGDGRFAKPGSRPHGSIGDAARTGGGRPDRATSAYSGTPHGSMGGGSVKVKNPKPVSFQPEWQKPKVHKLPPFKRGR